MADITTEPAASAGTPDEVTSSTDPTSINQSTNAFAIPLPNPLLAYPSYTYGLSLHLLTKDEYKDVVQNQSFTPKRVLIASAGRWSDTFPRSPYFNDDFYFQDLTMNTIIAANEHARATNAIDIKFTIVEPYGITLMNRLLEANAAIASSNYIDQPYLLQIDFFAINDSGIIQGIIPNTTKYIPIKLVALILKANNKGAEYAIQAFPYSSSAWEQSFASAPVHFEVMSGSLESFFSNNNEDAVAASAAADQREVKTQNFTNKNDVTFTTQRDGTSVPLPLTTVSQHVLDITNGKDPTYKVQSYCGALNSWNKQLQHFGKLDTPDIFLVKIHDDIKAGQDFVLQTNMASQNTAMAVNKDDIEKHRKSNVTDNEVSALSYDNRVFSINAGTSIDKVIDFAMKQTKYLQDQMIPPEAFDNLEAYLNKVEEYSTKPLRWYKIIPTILLGDYDSSRECYSRIVTYNIIPQLLYHSKLKVAPQGKVPAVVKQHNYYYTGKNDDVLEFNLEFNTLYYTAVTAYREHISQLYNLGKDETIEQKNQKTPNSKDEGQKMKIKPLTQNQIARIAAGDITVIQAALSDVEQSIYTSSQGDMIQLSLKILGDPQYIKQDDLFYPPTMTAASTTVDTNGVDPRLVADGSLHMDTTGVYINITVRSPVDIDEQIGLMRFDEHYTESLFSGIYQVVAIDNTFSGGQFTQIINAVRQPHQPDQIIENKPQSTQRNDQTLSDNVETTSMIVPSITQTNTTVPADTMDNIFPHNIPTVEILPPLIDNSQQILMNLNSLTKSIPINSSIGPQAIIPSVIKTGT